MTNERNTSIKQHLFLITSGARGVFRSLSNTYDRAFDVFLMKEQNFNEQEHGFRSKFKNKLKTDESLYIASEQRD